jgi:hypothetical protein
LFRKKSLDEWALDYWFLQQYAKICFNVYYRKVEVINRHRIPKNQPVILAPNHQNALMDVVLAKYADGDSRKYLLMVQYKNSEDAVEVYGYFGRGVFSEGLAGNCLRLEDNSWIAAALDRNVIIAVFNAKTNEGASHLLNHALQNNQVKS